MVGKSWVLSAPEIALVMAGGVATLLSPCGYALIPAYVGYSVTGAVGVGRALIRSALVSAGVVAVYAVMSALIFIARESVRPAIPHLSLLSGALILSMGLVKILSISLPTIPIMKTPTTSGESAFLLFGVGYGLGASGCNLPIFISVLVYATLAAGTEPLIIMLSYAVGVVAPLFIVGTLASLLGQTLVRRMGKISQHAHHAAGAVMAGAGTYLIYFYLTAYVDGSLP